MDRVTTFTSSPTVMYARIFGIVLTLVGIAGLAINTEQSAVEPLLGFDVNLTHNLVHLATGVIGLVVGFWALRYAATYAIVFGVVYTLLGVWGLAVGENFDPLDLFVRINIADSILHVAIGALGIGAWIASRDRETDMV